MEQDCSWAGMLQIFQFCQNQSFSWGRTGVFEFVRLFVCLFLNWNCQMIVLFCFVLALIEQFTALQLNCWVFSRSPQDKSSGPCYLPMTLFLSRPHGHLMITTPAPFLEGACWRRSRCSSLDQNTPWELLDPALLRGEEALAKSNIPKHSARLLFCQKYCTSAGLSWAEEKPWILSGIRWVVWSTFTGERRIKNKTHARSKPHTVHFQFKVHELRETAYI